MNLPVSQISRVETMRGGTDGVVIDFCKLALSILTYKMHIIYINTVD